MSIFILSLLAVALIALQVLFGGAYLVLSLPCYGIVALAGFLSWIGARATHLSRTSHLSLQASAIFCGYVLLRALYSEDNYIARADIYMVLASLIVYLSFALVITSSRLRVQFVAVLLLLAAVNFVIGGIQYFKGHNFMPFQFLPRGNYGARASGFFGCPNHLAGFLEVVMLFALALAFWSRYRLLTRVAAGYAAVMCAATLVLTVSRGGFASALAGLIAFGFLSLLLAGKWLRREFWYALLASTVLAVLALGFSIRSVYRESEFLRYRVEGTSIDATFRVDMAKAALRQFEISPWLGTGSRTYLFYGRQFRAPLIQADPIFAHNDWAQFLAEYGLFGVAGLGLFLTTHFRNGWKFLASAATVHPSSETPKKSAKRREKGSRSRSAWRAVADEDNERAAPRQPAFKGSNSLALTIAAISSVVAYAIHSLVDFNLHIPANACLMAFVFGVLANPGTASTSDTGALRESSRRWSSLWHWVPPALGVWLSVSALPTWPAEYFGERARRLLSDWRLLDTKDIATEAEAFSRKGIEWDPKNPELFYNLGESQTALAVQADDPADRKRLYEQAVASYESALQLSPSDVRYVLCLAWSMDALERFDDAERIFLRAFQLDPNSARVHLSYAAHFHQQQKLDQAEEEYLRARDLGGYIAAETGLANVRKDIQAKKNRNATPPNPAP